MLLLSKETDQLNLAKSQAEVAADCGDSLGHPSYISDIWKECRLFQTVQFMQYVAHKHHNAQLIMYSKRIKLRMLLLHDWLGFITICHIIHKKICKLLNPRMQLCLCVCGCFFFLFFSAIDLVWAGASPKHTHPLILDSKISPFNGYSHTTSNASSHTEA